MKKALFITYFLFLSLMTLFSYFFVDPNLIYLENLYTGFAYRYRLQTIILYVLIISLSFIFYFLFLWLLSKKRLNGREIRLLIFTTVGILFFSYPAMLSYDIFNYIFTSKVLYFYHENPYIIMPIEIFGDPLLSFTHAANKIALYGPSWILITAIPYIAGLGNFLLTLFSFKLFMVLFYFGTVFLISKISKNVFSICLFALNPLILIETLVSSHNDIAMIFLSLLSFFLLKKKRILEAFILLILSILIKYATFFLIPVFAYVIWKSFRKERVDWKRAFYLSAILMMVAFLLSPLREEIYPWYAMWFLPFVVLVYKNRILLNIALALCFGLMLRYIPFMLLGTYVNPIPTLKTIVTFFPVIIVLIYIVVTHFLSFWIVQNPQTQKRRLWSRLRSSE